MCVVTVLHCSPCKIRKDMPEEGLIITRDWHTQLLVNLDTDTIPFKRCIDAINHALSDGRSDLTYPRCRNVKVKHMVVTSNVCFRCTTRRKIQNLIAMRKLHEEQFATWQNEKHGNTETVNDLRRSIRESPRATPTAGRERVDCAAADLLTTTIASTQPMVESWERSLERQIQQRELAKTMEAERQAKLTNDDDEKREQRKQARLNSVYQCLARANRLRHAPSREDDTDHSWSNRGKPGVVSRQVSPQESPALPTKPTTMATTMTTSSPSRSCTSVDRFHRPGLTSGVKIHLSDEDDSVGSTVHPVDGSVLVRLSSLRPEAPVFNSIRICRPSLWTGSLRAEAPAFKPLRQAPPIAPRMMRAPIAPRAMREGSLRQESTQSQQRYFTVRGYPTLRGLW